jgi:GAF domain-containing protein
MLPVSGSVSGIVLESGQPLGLDDFSGDERAAPAARARMHLGPAVVFPLGAPGNVRGILTAGRCPGSMPLAAPAVEMLVSFAAQAGVGLELAEHRRDAQRVAVFQDRTGSPAICTTWSFSGSMPPACPWRACPRGWATRRAGSA